MHPTHPAEKPAANGLNYFSLLANETTQKIASYLTVKELSQFNCVCEEIRSSTDAPNFPVIMQVQEIYSEIRKLETCPHHEIEDHFGVL
jgi:hypothetical protein